MRAGFTARQLDVNDSEALARLADELESLDILINNAGYGAMGRCSTAVSRPCASSSKPTSSPWSA
jgi:short-subunit dehydrogenase